MLQGVPRPVRELMWKAKHVSCRALARLGFVESLHAVLESQLISRKIDVVIDVGANVGQYGRLLRRLGFRGRIVSLEPHPEVFLELESAARKDPGWEAIHSAVGREEGYADMNLMAETVFSSLHQPTEFAKRTFREGAKVVGRESVSVRRLDNLFADLLVDPKRVRVLIKTDTQGSDLDVVLSAGDALRSISMLQVELSVIPCYENEVAYTEVLSSLRDLGFDLVCAYPVVRDPLGRVVEFDGIFIAES